MAKPSAPRRPTWSTKPSMPRRPPWPTNPFAPRRPPWPTPSHRGDHHGQPSPPRRGDRRGQPLRTEETTDGTVTARPPTLARSSASHQIHQAMGTPLSTCCLWSPRAHTQLPSFINFLLKTFFFFFWSHPPPLKPTQLHVPGEEPEPSSCGFICRGHSRVDANCYRQGSRRKKIKNKKIK